MINHPNRRTYATYACRMWIEKNNPTGRYYVYCQIDHESISIYLACIFYCDEYFYNAIVAWVGKRAPETADHASEPSKAEEVGTGTVAVATGSKKLSVSRCVDAKVLRASCDYDRSVCTQWTWDYAKSGILEPEIDLKLLQFSRCIYIGKYRYFYNPSQSLPLSLYAPMPCGW